MPNVWVIILAWNGMKWLDTCLTSLLKTRQKIAYDILVVDNGSTDQSAEMIKNQFPQVELIQTHRNLGFAGGNNVGVSYALQHGADFILLLNQDTIAHDGWMDTLIEQAQNHPEIGILSPFQYDYEGHDFDRVFQNQLSTNTEFFEDQKNDTIKPYYKIPHVIGAAMLLRRNVFEALGSFDPFYFLYFEEKDLCRRTLAAGYEIAVVPKSKIGHYHGQLHAEELKVADVDGYFLRNRQVFILKDPNQSFLKNLYIFLRYGIPNSLRRKYDSPTTPPSFLKALGSQLEVIINLPRIFFRRRMECQRIAQSRKSVPTPRVESS